MSLFFVTCSLQLNSLLRKIRLTGGSCSCTTENFGSPEVRPPERKNFLAHKDVRLPERKFFLLTGGRGSCRAVISASRQVGKSAGQDVGRKFRLTRGSSSRTKVFSAHWRTRLLPSRNFGKSADRQVSMSAGKKFWFTKGSPSNNENFSAHKDVRPPKRKFFGSQGSSSSKKSHIRRN